MQILNSHQDTSTGGIAPAVTSTILTGGVGKSARRDRGNLPLTPFPHLFQIASDKRPPGQAIFAASRWYVRFRSGWKSRT